MKEAPIEHKETISNGQNIEENVSSDWRSIKIEK